MYQLRLGGFFFGKEGVEDLPRSKSGAKSDVGACNLRVCFWLAISAEVAFFLEADGPQKDGC